MRKIFLLVAFILKMLPCFSQQSTFVNITTKDGLPSSECYGMLQDSKGYLWIRTLNGICRYNGKSFKTFTKKDGLKDNAVYAFHEDKSGRLWFITASSYVGFIENDSIKYIPCAEALARENGFGQKIFYTIITDTDRNLYVASHERAYKISSRKNYTEFDEIDQTDFYFKIARIDNNYFTIPDNSERVLKNADDNVLPVSIDGKSIEIGWEIKPKKRNLYRMLYPCKSLNGSMYFNCENILYCLNDNGVLSSVKYNEHIYFLFIDNQNNLWVGLNSGGLLMYKNADSNGTPKHFFENKSISGVIQDFENGIWVSTLDNGLYYCKNLINETYSNLLPTTFKPEMLKVIDNELFLSDFKNKIFRINLDDDSLTVKDVFNGGQQTGILDIDKYENDYILSGRINLSQVDKSLAFVRQINFDDKLRLSCGSYSTIVSDTSVWGVSKFKLINYLANKTYSLPSNGNDIVLFKGKIYIATRKGLSVLSNEAITSLHPEIISEHIIKLLVYKDNLLCLGKDGSLFILNSHLQIVSILKNDFIVNDAILYNDFLLVAGNKGILKVDIQNKSTTLFNADDGLSDNEIFKIAVHNKSVFYATNSGLSRFDLEAMLHNAISPKIILSEVRVNGHSKGKIDGVFKYNSSIFLHFDPIAFKESNSPVIYYQLDGRERSWERSESGDIVFDKLAEGEYKLYVHAINSHGVKSEPFIAQFTIEMPFFKKWWFIGLMAGLVSTFIYVFYKVIFSYISKREAEKTRINKLLAEYQMMGLKAQMNPHFIFNCLNSIQNYVMDNQALKAYNYINKFSSLIRAVLDNSERNSIILADELTLLKLYTELEQLRFENKFSMDLNISSDIDISEVKIPPMIIQPFIENAIWHGLMNLPDTSIGKIILDISCQEKVLIVNVIDNGVGRSKASEFSRLKHNSKGLGISQRRISTLNYLMKTQKANVIVKDLYNFDNTVKGTQVIIEIPISWYE